jgi:hypothetical protein
MAMIELLKKTTKKDLVKREDISTAIYSEFEVIIALQATPLEKAPRVTTKNIVLREILQHKIAAMTEDKNDFDAIETKAAQGAYTQAILGISMMHAQKKDLTIILKDQEVAKAYEAIKALEAKKDPVALSRYKEL